MCVHFNWCGIPLVSARRTYIKLKITYRICGRRSIWNSLCLKPAIVLYFGIYMYKLYAFEVNVQRSVQKINNQTPHTSTKRDRLEKFSRFPCKFIRQHIRTIYTFNCMFATKHMRIKFTKTIMRHCYRYAYVLVCILTLCISYQELNKM